MIEIQQVGDLVRILKNCSITNEPYGVIVSVMNYNRWKQGELIQNVFPELSVEQREFLISKHTPEEWNAMFAEDELDFIN
jgi:hypothetical protein